MRELKIKNVVFVFRYLYRSLMISILEPFLLLGIRIQTKLNFLEVDGKVEGIYIHLKWVNTCPDDAV